MSEFGKRVVAVDGVPSRGWWNLGDVSLAHPGGHGPVVPPTRWGPTTAPRPPDMRGRVVPPTRWGPTTPYGSRLALSSVSPSKGNAGPWGLCPHAPNDNSTPPSARWGRFAFCKPRALAVCLLALLFPATAWSQVATLSEREAVQRAVAQDPTLRAAMLDLEVSAQAVRAQQGRYRPLLLLDATASTDTSPSLLAAGGTIRSTQRALVLGAEVSQTFSVGTRLDLRVENRTTTSEGSFGGVSGSLGPGYGLSVRFGVVQPLLRGFGDSVGEAALRAALLARESSARARDATASGSLSGVLQAYWELWYAQKALGIEREARGLVVRQREDAQKREAAGAVAPVDLLANETRLAELDQSVLAAEIGVRQRAVELRRALGEAAPQGDFDVSGAVPPAIGSPGDGAATLAAAQEAAYVIAQQQLDLARAEDALRTAGEATRSRLDLAAWVQAQGLGNDTVDPMFTQLGGLDNVSANVGLVFELPLSGDQHAAERKGAELALTAARARLDAVRQQIAAQTATELESLTLAAESVTLAERTAEVSRRSLAAQQKRIASGAGIPLEVSEAEDALRRALLAVERARVNGVEAQVRIEDLTGRLLVKWGVAP